MIRLFRHIRQGLFQEGKVSRYFGYAVGEIVLIVVGILIALQINDWNQARADAELEQRYIEQLIVNIESDIDRFETQIKINDLRIYFIELLMRAAKDPESVRGHAVEFMAAVVGNKAPAEQPLSSDTFDELVSTGHLKLLDSQLKRRLFIYYRQDNRRRQFTSIRHGTALEFRKLRKGILTEEQFRWAVDEVGIGVLPGSWQRRVLEKNYDEDSVVEAAIRLQNNEALVNWLPEVRKDLKLVNSQHDNRIQEAGAVLNILKEHQNLTSLEGLD